MKWLALALIRFYQACLSPQLPSSCRYFPSCSTYAGEAIERWGVWRGARMALGRFLRCRPLGGRGYDPVPEAQGPGIRGPGFALSNVTSTSGKECLCRDEDLAPNT
jgi:putative membrane protein insertion efficiency factor